MCDNQAEICSFCYLIKYVPTAHRISHRQKNVALLYIQIPAVTQKESQMLTILYSSHH